MASVLLPDPVRPTIAIFCPGSILTHVFPGLDAQALAREIEPWEGDDPNEPRVTATPAGKRRLPFRLSAGAEPDRDDSATDEVLSDLVHAGAATLHAVARTAATSRMTVRLEGLLARGKPTQ